MKKGITTLEFLLSIAVIAIILAVSIPFYFSFLAKSKVDNIAEEIVVSVHRAKLKAQASEFDNSWGVVVGVDEKITIFSGSDYASRDQSHDETVDVTNNITFDSQVEAVFSKSDSMLNSPTSISFHDTNNNDKTISIDIYGNTTTE